MSAIGLRVGPFEISDDVEIPGAGVWYRASRTGLTRRQPAEVLVRLLGPAPTTRELAAVQRQFDVLRAVEDPRFPKAVALYEGSGALAVDAKPGASLGRLVEARVLGDVTMTPATLLDLALDVTEALAHAHGRGFHHGHLSSDNVTLAADGALMVWGLGDAEARPPFSWLPPERARGESATALTDQWSLGALIVSLVTGRTPWSPGVVDADPRGGVIDDFVDPVARQWPALGRLVRRLMDANPTLRFPSLHPVRLELLALARRAGGTSDRRALASWLYQDGSPKPADQVPSKPAPAVIAAPVAVPVQIEEEAPPVAVAKVEDPATATTDVPAGPRAKGPTITVRSAPVDPRDLPPEIQSASRAASEGDAPSARIRPARTLPAESMAIVYPDQVPEDVPVAGIATSSGLDAGTPVRIETDLAEDILPTELASKRDLKPGRDEVDGEDALPTEMATEMLEDDEPMLDIPPVRSPVSVSVSPATLRMSPTPPPSDIVRVELTDEELASLPGERPEPVAAPTLRVRPVAVSVDFELDDEDEDDEPPLTASPEPSYGDQPAPTLPGMEVPEPEAAPRPVRAVAVELDEDDDDLLVEDPLIEDLTGPVVDRRAAVPVAVSIDSFDDLDDLDDLDDEPVGMMVTPTPSLHRPAPTVVPFTDPHFAGPELGLDTPMRPTSARRAAAPSLPALGLGDEDQDAITPKPSFLANARWPWERDDRADPEPPEQDFVVQAAPYVATATVTVLALLLAFNILL